MDTLIDLLLAFFILAFLIETMLLIGIYRQKKLIKKSTNKTSFFSLITGFHERNMNAVENVRQLKDVGLKIIYLGLFAVIIEFFYTTYYLDKTQEFVPLFHEYFLNISPAFTILGTGFAVYAFGVALSQK
jgi:hypothetical protein